MKLLAVGGGSGGHVTPVVAVINEIAALQPDVQVTFVCDKAFASQSRGLMQHAAVPVQVRTIAAGKFRRYQHLSVVRQLLMPSIVLANILDIFKILAGICQSLWLVLHVRPDVIFAKGGFVCLPVGIAARCLRVPVVIHDSDARPGLTNRVMARLLRAGHSSIITIQHRVAAMWGCRLALIFTRSLRLSGSRHGRPSRLIHTSH